MKSKPLIKKHQVVDGVWHRVHSHMGCCDCGLIHRVEYRGIVIKGKHYLEARAFRCVRLTAEARKKEKFPFMKARSK